MKRNLHAGKKLSGGFSVNVFTEDELYEIHLATLEVLQKTGIFVEDQEALDVFDGGGAVVDRKTRIVKMRPNLVEDAIRSAPPKMLLAGRTAENDFVAESNRVGFTTFGEGIQIVDPYTGELRKPTKADVGHSARLADYLSEVDVYWRALGAHDVPQQAVPLHNAEAFLSNTSKHCLLGPLDGYLARKLVDMAAAVVGGREKLRERPILTFTACPVSPLKLIKGACEIIMESARAEMGVVVISMAMSGGSSPVTLAGTLVTHNAEVLSGLVLSQLTRKGTPAIYGSATTCMDLRAGVAPVGCPEMGMIGAAVTEMGKYYQLPTLVAGG